MIVGAITAVWIVIAAVVILYNLPDGGSKAKVPDLTGVSQADAGSRLKAAGLTVGEVAYEESSTASPGSIIRTDPPANRRVKSGSRVKLVLATAPGDDSGDTLTLPDMTNKSQEDAIAGLTAAGLTPGEVTYEGSSTVAEGLVIRTEPAANTQVPTGTTVKIVIATKPGQQQQQAQPCEVPDVAHQPREYAESQLGKAKIQYVIKKEDSDSVQPGTVIRTDPGAGHLDQCRKVTVYVSQGVPVKVPDVIGAAESYARSKLAEVNLKTSVKRDNYCGPAQTKDEVVTAQNPAAGSTAHNGDTVTITIPKYTGACASAKTP
jgi:serine/threonine-protein kinase